MHRKFSRGFTLLEIIAVSAIIMTVAAVTIPMMATTLRSYRSASDARTLASQIALTRLRAANRFTRARLNLATGTSYLMELQANTGACNAATWVNEQTNAATGSVNNATPGLMQMSAGHLGTGNVTSSPPPFPVGTPATQPANNVVIFNSQGIPVDCNGVPVAGYGIYLTNTAGEMYAVTVFPSGKVSTWKLYSGTWRQI